MKSIPKYIIGERVWYFKAPQQAPICDTIIGIIPFSEQFVSNAYWGPQETKTTFRYVLENAHLKCDFDDKRFYYDIHSCFIEEYLFESRELALKNIKDKLQKEVDQINKTISGLK